MTISGDKKRQNTCHSRQNSANDASIQEDRAWILKAQQGDTRAFDRLVLKYQRSVYFLALKMVGNPADAEDVVQDSFIRAYNSLDHFDTTRPFKPWLFRIAMNLALTILNRRKQRHSVTLEDAVGLAAETNNSPGEPDPVEIKNLALKAAQALPEDQRVVLLLRIQEQFNYDQIAEVLEVPVGTVMSRLNRARQKLKELLKDYL
jgi:RNA polymerase sigma-70 factor (ECF subfamily)